MSWSNALAASSHQYALINTTGEIKHGRADPALSLEERVTAKERVSKTIPINWLAEIVTTKQSNESRQTTKTHTD
jgi:hypothetical protein